MSECCLRAGRTEEAYLARAALSAFTGLVMMTVVCVLPRSVLRGMKARKVLGRLTKMMDWVGKRTWIALYSTIFASNFCIWIHDVLPPD